jgi:hypothetical protein
VEYAKCVAEFLHRPIQDFQVQDVEMGLVQAKDPSEKFFQKRGGKIIVGAIEEETDLVESFLLRQCASRTSWRGFHRIIHHSIIRGSW